MCVHVPVRAINVRPVIIERMGVCTDQAIKIRNLVKTTGTLPGIGGSSSTCQSDTRASEELRAAREHARVVEQHAEILVLSLRWNSQSRSLYVLQRPRSSVTNPLRVAAVCFCVPPFTRQNETTDSDTEYIDIAIICPVHGTLVHTRSVEQQLTRSKLKLAASPVLHRARTAKKGFSTAITCAPMPSSPRFERLALLIQRKQEHREFLRQAALGLGPPGITVNPRPTSVGDGIPYG